MLIPRFLRYKLFWINGISLFFGLWLILSIYFEIQNLNIKIDLLSETKSTRNISEYEVKFKKPVALINGQSADYGYLRHVKKVLTLLGYEVQEGLSAGEYSREYELLWNHEYPFSNLKVRKIIDELMDEDGAEWRRINHIPGVGLPKAFDLPKQRTEFEKYAKENPEYLWVQKSNAHRGIQIRSILDLELNKSETFVQKYVENPLLIDGRKFDFGVYVVITSIEPLRVYVYNGDVLLRFCPQDYLPLDPDNVDKYVVGDEYTPLWQMPSLKDYYLKMKLNFKESFNAYLRKKLKSNSDKIYEQINEIIRQVFETQNRKMKLALQKYKNKRFLIYFFLQFCFRKFFELSRFDFLIDEELNVYLMEANMSPNLSSDHFLQNAPLYEQVLLNIFSLIGLANPFVINQYNGNLLVSERNLFMDLEQCRLNTNCAAECSDEKCVGLCSQCISDELKETLKIAYMEQINKRNMLRILPDSSDDSNNRKFLGELDYLQVLWFKQRCKTDKMFC